MYPVLDRRVPNHYYMASPASNHYVRAPRLCTLETMMQAEVL